MFYPPQLYVGGMNDSAKRSSEGRNIKCGFGVALEKIALNSAILDRRKLKPFALSARE